MKNLKVKKVSILLLAACAIIGTMLLAGCSKDSKSNTRTIKDCSGAEVEISTNIQKVIAPHPPFVSFMIAMGEGDKLVGTHGAVIAHTWAPYFKEDITQVEQYGYRPDAEVLLAADVDLVVVKNAAYAETLRNAGVPAIYFGYNNIEELYYAVDLMGEIFGDDAKAYAEKWKANLEKTIATLDAEVGSIPDSEKKTVYYINGAVNPSNVYTTLGGGTFTEYWINTIGGNFATSEFEDIEELDQEVAISLNPDVIFISGYSEHTRYDELMADTLWTDIDAVKNGEIYLMPTSLVSYDRFAVELPLLLDYSASVLYPDRHQFGGIETMRTFFEEYYGKTFTDGELNYMLSGLGPDGRRMDEE